MTNMMRNKHDKPTTMTCVMLTVQQAADILVCSPKHVRHLLQAGLIKGTRLISPGSGKLTAKSRWRVYADSIDAYLGIVDVKPSKQRASAAHQRELAAASVILGLPQLAERAHL